MALRYIRYIKVPLYHPTSKGAYEQTLSWYFIIKVLANCRLPEQRFGEKRIVCTHFLFKNIGFPGPGCTFLFF